MREQLVDYKLALRLYRRTPVSTLIAVAVLAVGIAFVSALLSLYADLVLKPFRGIQDSDGVVTIAYSNGGWLPFDFTERMSEEVTSLETVVGIRSAAELPYRARRGNGHGRVRLARILRWHPATARAGQGLRAKRARSLRRARRRDFAPLLARAVRQQPGRPRRDGRARWATVGRGRSRADRISHRRRHGARAARHDDRRRRSLGAVRTDPAIPRTRRLRAGARTSLYGEFRALAARRHG